jgi:hypothetical protein
MCSPRHLRDGFRAWGQIVLEASTHPDLRMTDVGT